MVTVLMMWALAQAPNYDAFCDRDGNLLTHEHGLEMFAVLQRPGQVEAMFADAAKGNPRAKRVVEILETDYFPDIGRALAEKVSQPPCLIPALRELSGWCVPDWGYLDFLSKDQPGGVRLRRAFFDGYAERIRQRQLENQLVVSAANAILGVTVAAAAIQEAKVAAGAVTVSRGDLLKELAARGIKHSPERIVFIERVGQRIVFLEQGSTTAGLAHILERHGADFARRGISSAQLPEALLSA